MTISTFITQCAYMIERPYSINQKQGFHLKNGMKILFKDHRINAKAISILKRHYEKAWQGETKWVRVDKACPVSKYYEGRSW